MVKKRYLANNPKVFETKAKNLDILNQPSVGVTKMRNAKNLIEIVSVLGLIIGLGLVIAQLRQNEQLIRFQIATDFRFNQDSNRNAIKGEDFSKTLAKLQSAPESLTDAELLQFQAHARSSVSELERRLEECSDRPSFLEAVRHD